MNRLKSMLDAFKSKIQLWLFEKKLDFTEEPLYSTSYDEFLLSEEVEQQNKLAEGLLLLKRNVKTKADTDLDNFLRKNPDLTKFAEVEDEVKDLIRNTWNTLPVDIVTDEDKVKMIDSRIQHYYELQRFNEERALIKKIRKAKKEQDTDLELKLFKEWKVKYENHR